MPCFKNLPTLTVLAVFKLEVISTTVKKIIYKSQLLPTNMRIANVVATSVMVTTLPQNINKEFSGEKGLLTSEESP